MVTSCALLLLYSKCVLASLNRKLIQKFNFFHISKGNPMLVSHKKVVNCAQGKNMCNILIKTF